MILYLAQRASVEAGKVQHRLWPVRKHYCIHMKTHGPLTWLTCLAALSSILNLAAEEIAVVRDGRVNVRGQPSLVGEVITQLQKGEKVVILEQITAAKAKTNEPSRWARIQMPANTPVWLYAPFIDPANKTVKVSRLNLRAGPGENYSVVGRLERGAAVTEIRRVEDWMEVETPPGAYGFVAADLLTKAEPGTVFTAAKRSPTPTPPPQTAPLSPQMPRGSEAPPSSSQATPSGPASIPAPSANTSPAVMAPEPAPPSPAAAERHTTQPPQDSQLSGTAQTVLGPIVSSPSSAAPEATTPAPSSALPVAEIPSSTPAPAPTPVPPAAPAPAPSLSELNAPSPEAPPLRRIVRREGLVRTTLSIQAPTYYELLNPQNRKTINYLHTDSNGTHLKDYRGRRIVVTGEEGIDPRWPKTPVIEVETIDLIP